jgi:membrane-associated phospholipid phosphatase
VTARPRTWPFLLSAALLAVALAGTYVFFVRGYMGQVVDERAKDGAHLGLASRPAQAFLDAVPLACLAAALLAVVIGLVRRRVALTAIALMVVAGANITTQLLKHTVLTRPDTGATDAWHNSFPSGHTTVVASIAFALFLVTAPRLRPLVAVLGSVATVFVGALLVGTQWHRPSDVVGAILVVGIWGCLGGAVATRARAVSAPARPAGLPALWTVAAVLGAVASIAFAAVYLTADEPGYLTLAALGGVCAIAAAGAINAAAVTGLFHRVG